MALLEDAIGEIRDPDLRHRVMEEVRKLKSDKKFGLVFEEHRPEVVPLYSAPIKKGARVALKSGPLNDVYRVVKVGRDKVTCIGDGEESSEETGEEQIFGKSELVAVKRFGEPIYPTLVPMDRVERAPGMASHTLIEADNYHALQLLEYLYAGKVDCIYIDPPYNTGARDWKYNNDYVDANDGWRHSKWLAFMEKRLRLAKRLLNPSDSTLIVAIDDNEIFTLGLLLDDVFKGCDRQIVSVTINPKGKARDGRLSQVDEYLIVVYIGEAKAQELSIERSEVEVRWPYLRRSDVESARGTKKGGVRQFYPIYVDERTQKIVAIGEPLTPKQSLTDAPSMEGAVPVFPIRDDGKHMNWGLTEPSLGRAVDLGFVRVSKSSNVHQPYNFSYITVPSIKKVEDGIYRVAGVKDDGSKIVVIPGGKSQRGTTAWKKNLHDANAYGSQIVSAFVQGKKFPFPKSIYAVFDTLQLFLANKPNALLVDFFAGSGTTLNAVNLLNVTDGGQRQCILVTNNEVSEEEARNLTAQGLQPGQDEWDKHGICRSVTWPRSKFAILGRRDDGTPLPGEYSTGRTLTIEKARNFHQLSFADGQSLTVAQRKHVAKLVPSMTQSKVTANAWFLDEDSPASVLWDITQADAYLEVIQEAEHVTDFYVVTTDTQGFNALKPKIIEALPPLTVEEEEKRPLSKGFEANLQYFKLDFLDPLSVELGREFSRLLPTLWMMAGCRGHLPSATDEPYFLPSDNSFAVLIDETRFSEFEQALNSRSDITHVFLVTDSMDAFHAMKTELPHFHVVQLYRNYLDNFRINTGERQP